jgi:hypothetical protein
MYPGAQVFASTLDAFLQVLQPFKHNLPIVTGEIGYRPPSPPLIPLTPPPPPVLSDVWINGIVSDPYKAAQHRALARVFDACLSSSSCTRSHPYMLNITRWLIKPPEHTWGLPNVNDATAASSWSNALFEENRKLQGFTDCESAWGEQRMFNQFAVEAAAPNPQLQQQMIAALQEVEASEPDLSQHSETQMSQFTCGKTSFATGAHAASQRCSTSHRF